MPYSGIRAIIAREKGGSNLTQIMLCEGNEALCFALENWARHVGGGAGLGSRCSSIESKYKPPQQWAVKSLPKGLIDIASAERMEKWVCGLPQNQRMAMKHFYVYKSDPVHACRRMKIGIRAFWELLTHAHKRIRLLFF